MGEKAATVDQEELARRFARRDDGVMSEVYRRFGRPAFTVALRVLADRQLAEEAVQEGFVKAWQAADRYRPAQPLGAWLFAIVQRAAIDTYRRERRHSRAGNESLGEEADPEAAPPSLEQAWEAWQVRQAVDLLADKEREVVRMAHFGGMTHQDIADKLKVSIGTVKSRSHRAHRRLAGELAYLAQEQG